MKVIQRSQLTYKNTKTRAENEIAAALIVRIINAILYAINRKRKMMQLIMLLMLSLTVAGVRSLISHTPTWPANLEVIKLSDGGICLSPESAVRLAEFRGRD